MCAFLIFWVYDSSGIFFLMNNNNFIKRRKFLVIGQDLNPRI
jgi:hypothetical protein